MNKIQLKVNLRSKSDRSAKNLRLSHIIPAVVYGHKMENLNISIPYSDFNSAYKQAGRSSLVELEVDGKDKILTLIQEVSYHPVTDQVIHVDFHKVNLKEKIHTEIPIVLDGEAPAEKELGGSLIQNIDVIRVEALPNDLISEIIADVSVLKTFEDSIKISDLDIPETLEVKDELDTVVAFVQEPRSEEELAELEEEVKEDVENIEVEKKGKEDEEGEEVATETDGSAKNTEVDKKE